MEIIDKGNKGFLSGDLTPKLIENMCKIFPETLYFLG
jgi:hypothetical protein